MSDYFGIPVNLRAPLSFHAGFHRSYNLIWNEWFRDQNLQASVDVPLGDGPDLLTTYQLLRRNKRHDYFTSCLPWPQKGPSVPILSEPGVFGVSPDSPHRSDKSIDDNLPIFYKNDSSTYGLQQYDINLGNFGASPPGTPDTIWTYGQRSSGGTAEEGKLGLPTWQQYLDFKYTTQTGPSYEQFDYVPGLTTASSLFDPIGHPYTGLSQNPSEIGPSYITNTINTLRQAFQVQKMFERDARGGTRYIEIIKSHFGVTSPDARLQRPEYLGGGSSHININPVAQTSAEINSTQSGIDTTPPGSLSAFATTTHRAGFAKSFVEHCLIIGMVSVRADLTYQQGLNRMFSRRTRFDFYWPALAHLGEQAVLNQEIFASGLEGSEVSSRAFGDMVFGYQERYAEYRYKPSQITGLFRSNTFTPPVWSSLDPWHLAQVFTMEEPLPPGGIAPILNSDFIQENVPMDRILAVPTEPDFIFDSHFTLKCARPMPTYSVPGLVDHF